MTGDTLGQKACSTRCEVHIADDDPAFARTLERLMRREGVQPTSIACDGRELLRTLHLSEAPAILYIDIDMPEQDGLAVLHDLFDLDRPLRMRFMTGSSFAEALAAFMTADVRGLNVGRTLSKPVSRETLRGALEADFTALGLAAPPRPGGPAWPDDSAGQHDL